jgi:hypothetical protein
MANGKLDSTVVLLVGRLVVPSTHPRERLSNGVDGKGLRIGESHVKLLLEQTMFNYYLI